MIIVLRPDATTADIDYVVARIHELGLKPHVSQGEHRTIIGVIGDENKLHAEPLQAIVGVEQVLPIMKPYKLASREFHKKDTVVTVGKVKIGGGSLGMIAGPCAIENLKFSTRLLAPSRSGCEHSARRRFQARHEPLQLQGLGEEGLKMCVPSATSTICLSSPK